MQNYEQAVFISYAWEGEPEEIVNQIDEALQKRGVKIIRAKRELRYKGSIKEFMERIGRGNCVIVVVSDKYLRSANCMFELVEIAENNQFYNRIFPIVLSDANIYDPVRRIEYVKYWEDKISELNNAMKNVGQMNLQGIRDDIDQYDRIRDKISGLTSILKDMNTLTPELHQGSNFSILYDAIETSMKEGAAAPPTEVERATALLYDKPGKISKPKHWVGREDSLVRVNQLLDQSHKVLLTGMGGIGKTSLAQMLVEERLQAGSKPILWLEVGDEKVNILIEALAEQCGDDKILSVPNIEAKKLALKELLEKYGAGLLVIDNVRNLIALDDLLEALPDKLPVLMTSRMSFETDDIEDVSQLPPKEGLELLAKTSGAKDYSTNESAKALCQLFGYHPLALEIAGASMKERRGLTPAKLLERLKSNPIKLSSLRRGEIRPLLDNCVADLPENLQTVFFAFGKFPGNRITPTLLALFLNKSIEDVTDALEALVLRNLVKSEDYVYYLHDLIFHYVQTAYGPNDQDKRHLLQTAISYLEQHRYDYDLVVHDLFNILGIARITEGVDLVKIMSYLAIGNYPVQEGKSYVDQKGYSIRLIEQLDRVVATARNLGDEFKLTTHYLLGKRGNAAFWRGEYELAAEKYRDELSLSNDDESRVKVGSNLASTLAFCGKKEEAREHFDAAQALAEKLSNDELRIYVLEQEIWAAGYLRDFKTALQVVEKQLPLTEALHEKDERTYEYLAFALMNLGSAKLELSKEDGRDVDDVLESFRRAQVLAKKYENDHLLAQAYTSLGEYYHYIGEREQAKINFNSALKIRRDLEMIQYVKELESFMAEHGYSVNNQQEDGNENPV